jgi:cytochrome b561
MLAGHHVCTALNAATPTPRYDAASQALHWLTALAATIAFILGPEHFGHLEREGIDPGSRLDIVWHESLGLTVFALTLVRLLWAALRAPKPRFELRPWMSLASRVSHAALWALLVALPITALLGLGGEGHPLTLLGGLRVEHLTFIESSRIAQLTDWGDVHGVLGDTLMWLAGLHAAAALYHHFVLKDGVLRAMLPDWR